MLVSSCTPTWTERRNLNLLSERESTIYIMGRIARGEDVPASVWEFLVRKNLIQGPVANA